MSTSLLPRKTDELCAPIETNSIYSCRKDQNIVLNFLDGKTVLWISRMIWKHTEST